MQNEDDATKTDVKITYLESYQQTHYFDDNDEVQAESFVGLRLFWDDMTRHPNSDNVSEESFLAYSVANAGTKLSKVPGKSVVISNILVRCWDSSSSW